MKKWTKLLAIVIALCSLYAFAACAVDPVDYHFSYDELSDIVSIELIQYNNSRQKSFLSWVPDHTSDLKPFDEDKLSVLETLDEDRFPQFIDMLCECCILDTYYAYDSPNGTGFKLTYSNGDFLIVSCNEKSFDGYIGKFSSDGKVVAFIGCFTRRSDYEALMNEFFPSE